MQAPARRFQQHPVSVRFREAGQDLLVGQTGLDELLDLFPHGHGDLRAGGGYRLGDADGAAQLAGDVEHPRFDGHTRTGLSERQPAQHQQQRQQQAPQFSSLRMLFSSTSGVRMPAYFSTSVPSAAMKNVSGTPNRP